ncbi:short-chain dehydrogenase [Longimycelium tulufanense]|uniref:Short-chain dehydrogenase n=1 Tax=Longimycelium tulufanense TaxID=907463 RepID=A0A8J3FUZ8_9PSEU|nr:SDR family NAD(P)-dependent oxidoreductase [Longimycelium tulufanense]GGM54068.1 short-chain dehydrogenase [Longimycelium tulufanense]
MSAGENSGTTPRTALVTGGNRGTGRAIVERLEVAGTQVWQLNRTPCGAGERELICDLSDVDAVDRLVRRVVDASGGRLDLLVANAADRYFARVSDLDAHRWSQALTVNLSSILVAVRAALPALRAAHGTVVLMGSHAGTRFFEEGVSYCAAKAAMKAVCEVLLLEERPHGVRTCLVSPGAIANLDGDTSKFKMAPASVAEFLAWLASAPADVAVGEIEMRPAVLPPPVVTGLDRLQAV